jgi:hypothetical protein
MGIHKTAKYVLRATCRTFIENLSVLLCQCELFTRIFNIFSAHEYKL